MLFSAFPVKYLTLFLYIKVNIPEINISTILYLFLLLFRGTGNYNQNIFQHMIARFDTQVFLYVKRSRKPSGNHTDYNSNGLNMTEKVSNIFLISSLVRDNSWIPIMVDLLIWWD